MNRSAGHTWQSLGEAAVAVLETADASAKAACSRTAAAAWQAGDLALAAPARLPARPARPDKPELRAPSQMPRRGKAGSLSNRLALLHSLAHIELNAIDLAWDLIARFGAEMASAFSDDWVSVAEDESRHFAMLEARLTALGSGYGALPAHDGLWESAERTAHDLAARLAVVPLVLEARGLDVTPGMIERLENAGDPKSAALLSTIQREEEAHVAAGRRWFDAVCESRGEAPEPAFHRLVHRYFRGSLKPPFNHPARQRAGLAPGFYEPLAQKPS